MFEFIMQMFLNQNIQLYLLAYFIGSIPFGVILAKFMASIDIRNAGSKNIGATNVLRCVKEQNPSLAKKLAVLTVICDALKATLPIIVASYFGNPLSVLWMMGVMVVIGHCFSAFLKFEGGKGVATAAGVMLYFLPLELLVGLIVWAFSAKILKVSSLASFSALLAFMISSYVIHPSLPEIGTHAPIFIIVFIIVYKHIPNIIRLLEGKEKKVV